MHKLMWVISLSAILLAAAGVAAQESPAPTPQRVEIPATDDLYLPTATGETGAPAALLLHMLYSTRQSWQPLVAPLLEAGYAVLAVDLRGHGETGGAADWALADQDTLAWIAWLRQLPGIDPARINLVGSSIGANLALRAAAADDDIETVLALSPGLDYQGVTTEAAMAKIRRPVFIAVAQVDGSTNSVKKLAGLIQGEGLVRYYNGSRHGTQFLNVPEVVALMVAWLDLYNQD